MDNQTCSIPTVEKDNGVFLYMSRESGNGPSESILIQKMYAQVPQDCLNRQIQLHVVAKPRGWNCELHMARIRLRKSVCFPDPFPFVHELQETNPFSGLE